ncbi:MAG: armadillo/beta-catenin-like repeat-containing protein [Vulcanococcus sp.]
MPGPRIPDPVAPSRWDVRDEFLHLPGDGLMLVNSAGLISFFDNRARELMGPQGRHGRGGPLSQHWLELADSLEHLAIGAGESGPIMAIVPCGGVPRLVRLLRSDDGIRMVLVNDRQGLSPYLTNSC